MLAEAKPEIELSNVQRAVLEANRVFSEFQFLKGTSQILVENEWVYDRLNLQIKSRAVRLSEARGRLLKEGLLIEAPNGRVELTESGRHALQNGNGHRDNVTKTAPVDGLDPVARQKLDQLAEILSGGNCGYCDLDRLVEEYGISRGLCTNAIALQPGRFAIRDGRFFLLSYQKILKI